MRKSTTIWMKKKYGNKAFVCKLDPVKGYCFHVMIFGSGLIDPKPTDWFESIQVAKREGWQKVPR